MPNPAFLFQEKIGALSATSVGKEDVFGTIVTPTSTLPMTNNTLVSDPGLFYPELMLGFRDLKVFPLYGEQKNTGAIDGPLFPSNGMELLVSAIGVDGAAGQGVTGTAGGGVNTTLAAASLAGASTISLTAETGITGGTTIVQIDVNTGTTTTSECRLIETITGAGPYTATLDQPLIYPHANAVAVISVVAPFTHTISEANTLSSLTVEQNLGGFQSVQFGGTRINKMNLKGAAGNSEAAVTYDVESQSYNILSTPSTLSVVDETPFVFSEYTLEWEAGAIAQANNFSIDLENALKPNYTFNGSHSLQFLTPVTLGVTGAFDVVFDSLNDATYGYFAKLQSGSEGALTMSFTHPASGGAVTLSMPTVRLAKDTFGQKMADVIMETITWDARKSLSASSSYTIGATIVNGLHLAY